MYDYNEMKSKAKVLLDEKLESHRKIGCHLSEIFYVRNDLPKYVFRDIEREFELSHYQLVSLLGFAKCLGLISDKVDDYYTSEMYYISFEAYHGDDSIYTNGSFGGDNNV